MFVVGKSANGLTSWENADGITLKDIESDETKCNLCYCESDEN